MRPTKLTYLIKRARDNYVVDGSFVQGVGLRKTFHELLKDHNLEGLAVNNADTGNVELSLGGGDTKRQLLLDRLKQAIKDKTGHKPNITKLNNTKDKLHNIRLTPSKLNKLNNQHYTAYLRSDQFKPTNSNKLTLEEVRKGIMARYLLAREGETLTGKVPTLAYKQLTGKVYPYKFMTNPIRTRAEALAQIKK